jgi:hypothetical protein
MIKKKPSFSGPRTIKKVENSLKKQGEPLGTSLNSIMRNKTSKPLGTSLNQSLKKTQRRRIALNTVVEQNKTKMATKIQSAFRGRLNTKIRPHFLSKVCPDSSECLMLGKNKDIMFRFFEGFKNLKYLNKYELINSGANGSIFKLNFLKNGYNSYGAIKIASPFDKYFTNPKIILKRFLEGAAFSKMYFDEPDNMIYEYLVGIFLNQYISYLPNFLETYQLLQFSDFDTYKNILLQMDKSTKGLTTPISDLKNNLVPLNYDNILDPTKMDELKYMINRGCDTYTFGVDKLRRSYTYALMTQYVKYPYTLKSLLKSDKNFNNLHLIYILFQVYYTLSTLNRQFVHYDLHADNVLLYAPYPNGYIEYFYHIGNTVIQFKSKFIVKIIDYGRSYMGPHTKNIKEHIETTSLECSGVDAQESGYNIQDNYKSYFIDYDAPNVSHDLRLMSYLKLYYPFDRKDGKIILDILNKVQYNKGLSQSASLYFGTKPDNTSGYPTTINNVKDAFKSLKDGVIKSLRNGLNVMDTNLSKKAEMHIYGLHKPYEFKEV